MTLDNAEHPEALAGEYVLGTLNAADHEAFERALRLNPALLAEVYFWQDRLLPLATRVAPVQPLAELWSAIEADLPPPVKAAPPVRPADHGVPAANDPVWQRLRRWQWTGSIALAASVALASVLGLKLMAPPETPPIRYLAVLQAPTDGATGWLVEVTSGKSVRLIPLGSTTSVTAGKTLQFWTKPQGATGPTSLGLVTADRTTELPVTMLPAVGEQQLFELTLEPAGGSPLNRPTGPILFVGRTVRL